MKNTSKASAGYYTPEILGKFSETLRAANSKVESGDDLKVRISASNSKMGNVASVSTLPYITCNARCKDTCGAKCYAAKLANMRPSVLYAYAINTALASKRPDIYWNAIDLECKAVRYFRFHVSGDIMNAEYFRRMIETAKNNPGTEILCFTKQYEIVNQWIDENGAIPQNMHILFSEWCNLESINPHNMPKTNVFRSENNIKPDWKLCGGNCFNCACRGVGCWQAQNGDTIAFKMH